MSKEFEHPFKEKIEKNLEEFSLLGYRTLVFGTRYLSNQEFEEIEKKYQEAANSGERGKELTKLAMEVEDNLTLLGMTAVEDSLQKRVKETITRLLEADIKVWMITGDKLETAENIGIMAGIVTHQMEVFHLKNVTKENFMQVAQKLTEKINKAKKGVKRAIVFDMRSVGNINSLY